MTDQDRMRPEVDALLERGQEQGCLSLSEVDAAVRAAGLDDEEAETLYKAIEKRAIELRDDCGRGGAGPVHVSGDLAARTTTRWRSS
jgi:RNA polymerase primary sigma factor